MSSGILAGWRLGENNNMDPCLNMNNYEIYATQNMHREANKWQYNHMYTHPEYPVYQEGNFN